MTRPDPVTYKFRFGEAGGWDKDLSAAERDEFKGELRSFIHRQFKDQLPTPELERPREIPHQQVIAEWMNGFGKQKYFVDFTAEQECCYFIGEKWFSCSIVPFLIETSENVIQRWAIPVEPSGLKRIDIPMFLFVEWLCESF